MIIKGKKCEPYSMPICTSIKEKVSAKETEKE